MSAQPITLITTATGKTGRETALSLLSRGLPVRAMVHRADARAEALRSRGAEIVVGNLADVDDIQKALHGVQRAYWAAPTTPSALEAAAVFAAVAEEERLEVVVAMSQWLADPGHHSAHTRAAWLTDRVFQWMPNVGSITVNPGFFAENYMYTLDAVAQFGVLTLPFGEGLNAPPSNEDIAAVAAALLADPGPHLGRRYRPTGPELLSTAEFAEILGRILGRTVHYRDVPFALMAKSARSIGFSDYEVIQLAWYVDELKRGTFAIGAPTDAVQRLTGRPPEDMATIAVGTSMPCPAPIAGCRVWRGRCEYWRNPPSPRHPTAPAIYGRSRTAPRSASSPWTRPDGGRATIPNRHETHRRTT